MRRDPSALRARVSMRIDVTRGTPKSGVAMEITMADVGVELVGMQREVDMRARAGLVVVVVGMRVDMPAAVTVRVEVHCVAVVVVNGPVRVGNISVILIRVIRVIAMAGI